MSSIPTTRKPVSSGLSYHESTYWDERFSSDPRERNGFEWLSSSSSLLSLLPASVLLRDEPIRILHIGVGTSKLSLDVVRYWHKHRLEDWKQRAARVVNVDFSPKSIHFQREAERAFFAEIGEEPQELMQLMQYEVVNLLDWAEVRTKLVAETTSGTSSKFDLVLDKSTTDSISTGDDTPFSHILASPPSAFHRDVTAVATRGRTKPQHGFATTQMLGIHLGALVKEGGIWLCHSYSSDRWEDVILPENEARKSTGEEEVEEDAKAWPWIETDRAPVPVAASDPNAPQINHYIYTLQRT